MTLPAFLFFTVAGSLGLGVFVGRAEGFRGRPALALAACLLGGAFCALAWDWIGHLVLSGLR